MSDLEVSGIPNKPFQLGTKYRILFVVETVLLWPGQEFPLLGKDYIIDLASRWPAPYSRYFVLFFSPDDGMDLRHVHKGCLTEIVVSESGHKIAIGRHRVKRVDSESSDASDAAFAHLPDTPFSRWLGGDCMLIEDDALILRNEHYLGAAIPPQIYELYDAKKLSRQAFTMYVERFPSAPRPNHTASPQEMSYGLSRLLPLDIIERYYLFRLDSVIARLKRLTYLLEKLYTGSICCSGFDTNALPPSICTARLARCRDIIDKSPIAWKHSNNGKADDTLYTNPHGVVHDLVLVNKVEEDVKHDGRSITREHSWFHGYGWQIAYCGKCQSHIGWKFTGLEEEQEQDESFFALLRAEISCTIRDGEGPSNQSGGETTLTRQW